MSRNAADVTAALGASGSGKSAWLKRLLAREKPRRLIVWDPMREYGHVAGPLDRLSPLVAQLELAGSRGGFRLVFQPALDQAQREKQFDFICRSALDAGNLTIVCEELKFVTSPSRAPLGWAQVTMTGRHKGLRVIGTSQRPASIDKDFFGNCTVIHTGRLAYPEDVRTVARAMGVEDSAIPTAPLCWLEKNMQTGAISRGVLKFPKAA